MTEKDLKEKINTFLSLMKKYNFEYKEGLDMSMNKTTLPNEIKDMLDFFDKTKSGNKLSYRHGASILFIKNKKVVTINLFPYPEDNFFKEKPKDGLFYKIGKNGSVMENKYFGSILELENEIKKINKII